MSAAFVRFHDARGRKHEVATAHVVSLREREDGHTEMRLTGGQMVVVGYPIDQTLAMIKEQAR